MKITPKLFFALTGIAALSVVYPASVQAVPITYQYTGHSFTSASGSYTTSDFVSGMLTLAGPLAPNMPLSLVSPTAFSFSDGVQTITNLTATAVSFEFATGPTGAITAWSVDIIDLSSQITTQNVAGDAVDEGISSGQGSVSGQPGMWGTPAGVPDTGSTLSLMTLTLMALGVAARQFKRAAA